MKADKVDREQFTNVVRNLIAAPPMPKDVLSRKIARTARPNPKRKPVTPKPAQ
jgi:hypothetical protein